MDKQKLLAFRQKAIQSGFDPSSVDEYIKMKLSSSVLNQGGVSLIPNATGADVSLIPQPGNNQFRLLSAQGRISQGFGNYNPALYRGVNKSMRNTGIDIAVPEGTDVRLPAGQWKVVETGRGWNKGYGNSILVRNEQTGEKLRFSHLSKMANVKSGQKIQGGRRIAQTGRTGNVTGPHLDLEYYNQLGRLQDVLKSQYRSYL